MPYIMPITAAVFSLIIFNIAANPTGEYSGKVDVRVSEVLTKKPIPEDRSWPPENSQQFAEVNVRIFGENIDSAVLHNLKPDTSAMTSRKLHRIIGVHFQRDWMSEEAPKNRHLRAPVLSEDSKLPALADTLNFTFVDTSGVGLEVQPQMQVMLRQWMVRMATCPMDFIWEDLGPLFWPRWIKRGVCLNNHSCSWPSGMRCRPSGSRTLHLLRWVCKKKDSGKAGKSSRNALSTFKNKNDSSKSAAKNHSGRRRRRRKNRSEKRKRGGRRRDSGDKRRKSGVRKRRGDKNRRIRRLIKKLSLTSQGYLCNWELHQYVISDKCTCSCN